MEAVIVKLTPVELDQTVTMQGADAVWAGGRLRGELEMSPRAAHGESVTSCVFLGVLFHPNGSAKIVYTRSGYAVRHSSRLLIIDLPIIDAASVIFVIAYALWDNAWVYRPPRICGVDPVSS